MQRDIFKIERPADEIAGYPMPARSFTVEANEFCPDDRARAVRFTIWQDASALSGHTVVNGEFSLSTQERRDLVAFLTSLPDHND